MLEHRRAIFGDVFVEQNAGPKAAQQPCQRGLTFEERAISQVLAIMLDEGRRHRGLRFAQPPLPASPYPTAGATLFLETPFDQMGLVVDHGAALFSGYLAAFDRASARSAMALIASRENGGGVRGDAVRIGSGVDL
jgi:hypothetical protein